MPTARRLIPLLALLVLAPPALAGGEWKTVRDTNIRLRVPDGFAIATNVKGFQSIELQSTVMVEYIPGRGDLTAVRIGFTRERLAARGWTLLSKKDVSMAGGDGMLIHLEIPQGGALYRKWISLFPERGQNRVVSVHGVYPKSREAKIGEALKESVLSAGFADQAETVRTKALPFTLKPAKPLAHAKDHGPAKIYTEDGRFPLPGRDHLFLIAAPSTSTIGVSDRKGYAEKRVKEIESTKEVKVTKVGAVEIDGLPGFEVLARGKDTRTGESIFIYGVILYEDVQYYVIAGLVKLSRKSRALSLFRKSAETFERVKPEAK